MRVPHYLIRSPSGAYTFRLLVPRALRDTLGQRVIKRSLHTNNLVAAQTAALSLYMLYREIFREPRMGKTLEELLAGAQRATDSGKSRDYVFERDALGNITKMQADGPADHRRMMEALEASKPSPAIATPAVAPQPAAPTVAKVLTLKQASDLWLKAIEPTTLPKTHTIKAAAINQLRAFAGASTQLVDIKRPELAGFYQHLRDTNIATPTIVNKASYLRGFFRWCIGAGYYPNGDNPAEGHVTYGSREKRRRRKYGFQAFSPEQIKSLLSPTNFARLPITSRWAVLIGLYTGARASEVGQLLLSDIGTVNGLLCIQITDEGEDQHLKSEVSIRTVPIHADLIALGLNEYLDAVKTTGAKRVFHRAKPGAKNGAGNWISKAFGRYLAEQTKEWPTGKRGFHSLRKTVIQEMQGKAVASEMRAQIVGHELDDEHHSAYSRDFTPNEKLNGVKDKEFQSAGLRVLRYGLDMKKLRPLLALDLAP